MFRCRDAAITLAAVFARGHSGASGSVVCGCGGGGKEGADCVVVVDV
jgi:hypothetical protein